jgi:hypothetical protein
MHPFEFAVLRRTLPLAQFQRSYSTNNCQLKRPVRYRHHLWVKLVPNNDHHMNHDNQIKSQFDKPLDAQVISPS